MSDDPKDPNLLRRLRAKETAAADQTARARPVDPPPPRPRKNDKDLENLSTDDRDALFGRGKYASNGNATHDDFMVGARDAAVRRRQREVEDEKAIRLANKKRLANLGIHAYEKKESK